MAADTGGWVADTEGREGFVVIFRVKDRSNFYWWNIGGWQNAEHAIEREINGIRTVHDRKPGSVETDKWYNIKIVLRGPSIKCFLDGELIHDITDPTFPTGGIGLGSFVTKVDFTDLKVSTPNGITLYEASFKGGAK